MFGFSKKEMQEKLSDLVQQGMVQTYDYLKQKKFKVKGAILEGSELGQFAAAVTNYLFAFKHSEQHLATFDAREIESVSNQLISNNEKFKEFIVQSQKAKLISQNGYQISETHEFNTITEILKSYSQEFPKIPNPASYELLLNTWRF